MAKNKDTGVNSDLLNRIISASGNKLGDSLQNSEVMNKKDFFTTSVPAINIALSGAIDGGMTPGLLMIAGPSKSFKTLYMLIMAKAYLDKYPESIMILFDSEFGAALSYFEMVGIDPNRVSHLPITSLEDLRGQITKVLESINRGDKVFIGVDSLGNLASKKEINDAMTDKETADFTRAKTAASIGRIVTPHLVIKDIPMVVVNHIYMTMEMYAKAVIKLGSGIMYSCNDAWIISRAQDKDSQDELQGYKFTIGIEKSRSVVEKTKIPVSVSFDDGIDKFSGLLDMAIEGGFIEKPSKGKYCIKGDTVEVKEKDTLPLIKRVLVDPAFQKYIKDTYQLSTDKGLMSGEDVV